MQAPLRRLQDLHSRSFKERIKGIWPGSPQDLLTRYKITHNARTSDRISVRSSHSHKNLYKTSVKVLTDYGPLRLHHETLATDLPENSEDLPRGRSDTHKVPRRLRDDIKSRTAPQRERSDRHKVRRGLRVSAAFASRSAKYCACHERWSRPCTLPAQSKSAGTSPKKPSMREFTTKMPPQMEHPHLTPAL